MSADGQPRRAPPGAPPPTGVAVDLAPDQGFPLHVHDHHQVALAATGVLVMSGEGRTWALPRTRALWIPAGVPHRVAVFGPTRMMSAYVDPDRCPLDWVEPTVLAASGLLGELIAHLAAPDLARAARRRAEAVLWDLVEPLPVTTLSPPLPIDERARRVADALVGDVTDGRTLAAWGREVGASARTLARLFVAETGMGFERWRTTARLAAALPILASGTSVSATAHQVGYATPSAFVAAFRRQLGTTPATYFRPT